MCVCMYMCMCICMCVRPSERTQTSVHARPQCADRLCSLYRPHVALLSRSPVMDSDPLMSVLQRLLAVLQLQPHVASDEVSAGVHWCQHMRICFECMHARAYVCLFLCTCFCVCACACACECAFPRECVSATQWCTSCISAGVSVSTCLRMCVHVF